MRTTLFRREATDFAHEREFGQPLDLQSPVLKALTVAAALVAIALAALAASASYVRRERVAGYLAPTDGLIKVVAAQAGTVIERRIQEGQQVREGDTLFLISAERDSQQARAVQAAAIGELQQRRASLERDLANQGALAALEAQGERNRVRGLESELNALADEVATQGQRIASARAALEQQQALVAERFISPAQLRQKQDDVLEQISRLQGLQRQRSALARDLQAARQALAAIEPRLRVQREATGRALSALRQDLTEYEARRTVAVTAPANGTVTTILAERGQSTAAAAPLLSLLPEGGRLQAQLLLPSRAIGFVQSSQAVSLRLQAFPYQRYGSLAGVVKEVSRSLIAPGEVALPVALNEPVYRVTVELGAQALQVGSQSLALRSGMLLEADIALDRRGLVAWLFEPVLNLVKRV